jgi:hypothetical protein
MRNIKLTGSIILFICLISFNDCTGQNTRQYHYQNDSSNFENLNFEKIAFIEISYFNRADYTHSYHPKRLTKDQFEVFNAELKKSKIVKSLEKADRSCLQYSIVIYNKDNDTRHFYIYPDIIEESVFNKGNVHEKDRVLNNRDFFRKLWDDAKEEICDCPVIIDLNKIDSIPKEKARFYQQIDSSYMLTKEYEDIKEHYITGVIEKDSSDYFYINDSWIPKTTIIYTMRGDYSNPLKLMKKPSRKSKVNVAIPSDQEYMFISMVVKNCYKGWVNVSIKWKGKVYTGWVEYGCYCSNPFTTCC